MCIPSPFIPVMSIKMQSLPILITTGLCTVFAYAITKHILPLIYSFAVRLHLYMYLSPSESSLFS